MIEVIQIVLQLIGGAFILGLLIWGLLMFLVELLPK